MTLPQKRVNQNVYLNPFSTNVPLLHPLKILENLRFSDIFREYISGALAENEVAR